jgi:hypothetical protein
MRLCRHPFLEGCELLQLLTDLSTVMSFINRLKIKLAWLKRSSSIAEIRIGIHLMVVIVLAMMMKMMMAVVVNMMMMMMMMMMMVVVTTHIY